MQIHLSPRTLHFKKPARTSRGAYSEHNMIIVSITDDDGTRMGIGECAPLPDLSCDRLAYTRLSDVADLINNALASEDYTEYLRPYPALLFALESAMFEYQKNSLLYDTPFARGEVGIPINGLVWMSSYEEMLEQVKQKILGGFRCIKLKIGAIDWNDEIRLIEKIRSKFSASTLQLRVDANGAFSPDEAMAKLDQLSKYDIHSIEQPIKAVWQEGGPKSWQVMADLVRNSPLPIALDEELIGVNIKEEKRLLLETIRPHYIVLKPSLHGGITGTLEWLQLQSSPSSNPHSNNRARTLPSLGEAGGGSWITSALESNIGLKSIALLAARVYGDNIKFPQGLGTGQLFTDNIDTGIQIKRSKIWLK